MKYDRYTAQEKYFEFSVFDEKVVLELSEHRKLPHYHWNKKVLQ